MVRAISLLRQQSAILVLEYRVHTTRDLYLMVEKEAGARGVPIGEKWIGPTLR
jgi:hypothetical protein